MAKHKTTVMNIDEDDFLDAMFAHSQDESMFRFFMSRTLITQLRPDTIIGKDDHGYWFRQPEDPPERRRRAVEH